MRKFIQCLTAAIYISSFSLLLSKLGAEETTGEKVETKVDETVKNTKQNARKGKRWARNKTGNGSVKEDIKDSARNVGDEAKFQGKKLKRKVN